MPRYSLVRAGDSLPKTALGADCEACASGRTCTEARQCASRLCLDGRCSDASCEDGIQNGDETDVDCGGQVCPRVVLDRCALATDCTNNPCGSTCSTCDDGIRMVEQMSIAEVLTVPPVQSTKDASSIAIAYHRPACRLSGVHLSGALLR